jgi:hypothetical protein
MWRLKGCAKCRGDVYLDRDRNGWFEECLQCGHVQYLGAITFVERARHSPGIKEPVLADARTMSGTRATAAAESGNWQRS